MIAIMSDLIYRLASISMSEKTIDAGAFLFLQGDPVHVLHIVRAGTVHLVRHQPDGATAVLQRATEDKILAEASVYSETYHCDGLAVSPTTVFLVPVVHVKRLLEADRSFAIIWAAYLARELQATRKRAEIMSLRPSRQSWTHGSSGTTALFLQKARGSNWPMISGHRQRLYTGRSLGGATRSTQT